MHKLDDVDLKATSAINSAAAANNCTSFLCAVKHFYWYVVSIFTQSKKSYERSCKETTEAERVAERHSSTSKISDKVSKG